MGNRIASREAWLREGLSLGAAPTFAVMALLTAVSGPSDMLCASGSPLTSMAAMYGLMSAFHLTPWLKLISGFCHPERSEGSLRR